MKIWLPAKRYKNGFHQLEWAKYQRKCFPLTRKLVSTRRNKQKRKENARFTGQKHGFQQPEKMKNEKKGDIYLT